MKSCPFCGGIDLEVDKYQYGCAVHCNNEDCYVEGPMAGDFEEAWRLWNRRVHPGAISAKERVLNRR